MGSKFEVKKEKAGEVKAVSMDKEGGIVVAPCARAWSLN